MWLPRCEPGGMKEARGVSVRQGTDFDFSLLPPLHPTPNFDLSCSGGATFFLKKTSNFEIILDLSYKDSTESSTYPPPSCT